MVELKTAERLSYTPRGGAREFLGDAIEGKRADALNKRTGYAFSAGVDLDTTPKEKLHAMRHEEMIDFMSANDFSSRVTRVIYDTKDKEKQIAGFGYITRFEGDIPPRTRRVMDIAMGKVVIPAAETMFEMNFDAPWHLNEESYKAVLTDGMYEMLTEFFDHNPDAALMMYVNTEDVSTDGRILRNLGASIVGRDVYLNSPDPNIPEDNNKDTVYVLNRGLFERSLRAHERN